MCLGTSIWPPINSSVANDVISVFVHVPSSECCAICRFWASRQLIVDYNWCVVYFKFEVEVMLFKPFEWCLHGNACRRLFVQTESCSLTACCVPTCPSRSFVSLFWKWKCPVYCSPNAKLCLFNRIIVLVLMTDHVLSHIKVTGIVWVYVHV